MSKLSSASHVRVVTVTGGRLKANVSKVFARNEVRCGVDVGRAYTSKGL